VWFWKPQSDQYTNKKNETLPPRWVWQWKQGLEDFGAHERLVARSGEHAHPGYFDDTMEGRKEGRKEAEETWGLI
jgi:hypothetical protein